MVFNQSSYENARLGAIPTLEVLAPDASAEQPRLFVPLRRSELTGTVVGPLADLRLSLVFRFERAALDKVVEVVYRFPLPGDAAVTGVWVRFGDTEIRTHLRERQQAEQTYETAKAEGRQAALLTRESPDVFTLHVAGIRPDEDVTVETHLVQVARAEGEAWTLRVPLTTAPRYVRSDEVAGRHAHGQPLLVMRDPGHRFSLDLIMRGVEGVASPTHNLAVTPGDSGVRVSLTDGEVVPDRDLVLRWQAQRDTTRPTLQVWAQRPIDEANVYFLALAAPPAAPPDPLKPREVVLLVDDSGSMAGAKWEAATWAATSFLSQLTEPDRFALCLFDTEQYWLADRVEAATPANVEAAIAFVRAERQMGGTELGVALEQALRLSRTAGEVARHVLIITDAQVSDADRILRLVDEEARRTDHRRLSVICIDAAPNSALAREMADRGGGVARFLTSAPDEEDITTALDDVLADWAAPLAVDACLEINREGALSAQGIPLPGRAPGWSRLDLGDLPAGRAVWMAGYAPAAPGDDLVVRLAADGRVLAETRAPSDAAAGDTRAVRALFAAPRLNRLEGLMGAGYDLDALRGQLERLGYRADDALPMTGATTRVYAENTMNETRAALRGLLVRESLAAGLPTSETAFVAVRRDGDQAPVELSMAVGNALPAGWSPAFRSGILMNRGGGAGSPTAMFVTSAGPARSLGAISAATMQPSRRLREVAPSADTTPMVTLFDGAPVFSDSQATVFDGSASGAGERLSGVERLTGVLVELPNGGPDAANVDRGLTLLVYVGDRVTPRARVRLADLLRAGGRRPLNVQRAADEPVWIVLEDAKGAWAAGAPRMVVKLEYGR